MMKNNVNLILKEIKEVMKNVNEVQAKELVNNILQAKIVVTCGAGRMGIAARAFAMRLMQLGLKSYNWGDLTLPHIGKNDLLIICSGSGETQTIYDVVKIAKKNKAKISLITGSSKSRMSKLSDLLIVIPAPNKMHKTIKGFTSVQPMTTLNEQCLSIFFDALVMQLMKKLKQTEKDMWARHSNLE